MKMNYRGSTNVLPYIKEKFLGINMKMNKFVAISSILASALVAQSASAAIALDRTRIIFNGDEKSMTVNIENKNRQLPYLAQSWLEDANNNKVTTPLAMLPPIQRVEPGAKSQIKLQDVGGMALPQDRESLFYYNLREIPPKSDKPNTLQIALQTRIKLFYRPKAIAVKTTDKPWQENITLSNQGGEFVVNNPTPYYVTIVNAAKSKSATPAKGFKPMMAPPKGQATLGVSAKELGEHPVLTYINDYGGHPQLTFNCSGTICNVASAK